MNTSLTQEQIAGYRRDGFTVHPGLLSPAELAELRAAVDEAVASLGRKRVAGSENAWEDDGDSYYSKVFTQKLNLWRINPTIRRFMLGPEVGGMVSALSGVPGFRLWHDQALIKEPFANPTGWHLDNPYWSYFSRDAISIWIALDDATLENGCLFYIPGSQRLADFRNAGIGENIADLFKIYPEFMALGTVSTPVRAGGCVFHNGLTAHGAGANMTNGRRRAMTAGYMPEGSTFNGQQNVLPDALFKAYKVGDVLQDDDQNPRVWPL
jgi:ectoine hydroxylase-related dioxygenase (phytanoyl-CoA dioxygenase family)